jgi:vancomycin permeability regulator SanA
VSGRRVVRRTAVTVFVVGLIAGALLLGPAAYVRLSTASSRYAVADVPAAPVAIVFGAGVRAGAPSPFLRQRLDIAVELFRTGKVLGLLMTGDHGRSGYDEVGTMAAYVVERGVPESVIGQDHAGFDTYDSCYRAKSIFGVERATVVTQRIETVGVGADSREHYAVDTTKYATREVAATANSLWQSVVTRPEPRYLGPRETQRDAVTRR